MKLLGFDTETYLIQPTDAAPKPVCCTWADETSQWITDPWSMETAVTFADPSMLYVGQNIPYDLVLMMRWNPKLIPDIIRALDEGRVFDTAMRERMLYLKQNGGSGFDMFPSLEKLALKYLKLDLSAEKKGEDIWRLKYGTLDGIPFAKWPEAALQYAMGDARHTYDVFREQGGINSIQPTEQMQVQAAVVLNGIGTWGFAVNQDKRKVIGDKLEVRAKALHEKIDKYGWTGTGSQKKMMDLVSRAWHVKQLRVLHNKMALTGVGVDQALWTQYIPPTTDLHTALVESAKQGTSLVGLQFPPSVDWKAWSQETAKILPEVTMTKKGPSIAGEVLEELQDVVVEFQDYTALRHVEKMIENYISPYQYETVHPRFVPLVSTGRTGCRKPNCFSDDTEILTSNGWMPFGTMTMLFKMKGLDILPEVAQWEEGNINFTKALAWVSYNVDKTVHIKNTHIDLLVTEDHNCLLLNRQGNPIIYKATDYNDDHHWQIGAGKKEGPDDPSYEDWFLQLCVAVQADGNWQDGGWSFSFRKERKHIRFNEIMKAAGLTEFGNSHSVDAKGIRYRNRIYKGALADRLFSVLAGAYKLLPLTWLKSLSYRQMNVIGDESFLWDGLSTRKNNYSSSIKHNCDVMQALYIMTNNRTNQRIYMPPSGNPNYQCDITKCNKSGTQNVSKELISGPLAVSCCTVPSGVIVVRRNGKVMVTCQCQNIPRKDKDAPDECFRTMFEARKGTVLGTVDYSQLELCTLAATIRKMFPGFPCALGDAIDAGKDVHCMTGSLFLGISYEQMVAGKKTDEKIKETRQASKAINFGKGGGLGVPAMVAYAKSNYGVDMSIDQMRQLDRAWQRAWPEIPGKYLRHSADMVDGSPTGRFTAITVTGREKANCIYTEGSNYPFQGLAADGAKAAMWAIWKEAVLGWHWRNNPGLGYGSVHRDSPLRESRIVNFVHDEIVCEHPPGDAGKAALARQESLMVSEMTRICENRIKISVEGNLSGAWEH